MIVNTFVGNPPAEIKDWCVKQYLTVYKVQTTSDCKKTGIFSAQRDDASRPVKIDWGDGTVETVDGDVSQKTHTYSSVGEFTVKVSNIKTFAANISTYDDNAWYDTTSQNKYTFKELVNLNKAVTSIGNYAFENCTNLTSVTIPNSVTSIGDYAFRGCSSLTSVTIPDSVTSIGGSAFARCSGLTSVTIPNSVTSIGHAAFTSCGGLTSMTIGNSVESLGPYAFSNCSRLTSVAIPDSVTSIGTYAFQLCSGLVSVMIGNSVTSIGASAFFNCSNLTSVHVSDIAKWCEISFGNSTANPLYYAHNLYLNQSLVTDLTIPSSVTSIVDCAFYNCSGLTSVTIPDSVTSIGNAAFQGCTGLTSVTIPDSVTGIGTTAFYGCSGLTNVTIGDSVTSILGYAFASCSSMTSIIFNGNEPTVGGNAFYNTAAGCTAYADISKAWTSPSGLWNSITLVYNDVSDGKVMYKTSASGSWQLADAVVEDGAFAGFDGKSSAAVVIIPSKDSSGNGVTSIGDDAFLECTSLAKVTIPDSVTSIGWSAFGGCSGLTSVAIPGSVTSTGNYAFSGCSGLTSVTIPTSVTSIGDGAFYGCSSMTSMDMQRFSTTDVQGNASHWGIALPDNQTVTVWCSDGTLVINPPDPGGSGY